MQAFLHAYEELDSHRGCAPTALGAAFASLLRGPPTQAEVGRGAGKDAVSVVSEPRPEAAVQTDLTNASGTDADVQTEIPKANLKDVAVQTAQPKDVPNAATLNATKDTTALAEVSKVEKAVQSEIQERPSESEPPFNYEKAGSTALTQCERETALAADIESKPPAAPLEAWAGRAATSSTTVIDAMNDDGPTADFEVRTAWPLPAAEEQELPWQTVEKIRARSSEPPKVSERLRRGALALGPRTLQRRHADAHAVVATLPDAGVGSGWPVVLTAEGPLT